MEPAPPGSRTATNGTATNSDFQTASGTTRIVGGAMPSGWRLDGLASPDRVSLTARKDRHHHAGRPAPAAPLRRAHSVRQVSGETGSQNQNVFLIQARSRVRLKIGGSTPSRRSPPRRGLAGRRAWPGDNCSSPGIELPMIGPYGTFHSYTRSQRLGALPRPAVRS